MLEFEKLFVSPTSSIRDVMSRIDKGAKGIALVVNTDGQFLGTVTDGDTRRAILAGVKLDLPVQVLLEPRAELPERRPVVAPVGTSEEELLHLMNEHSVRHIPLLDERGCVSELAVLEDLVKEYELPLRAVVMAGGYGTRLHSLTKELPKPMLPVGGRPLLEHIVKQLRDSGIRRVNLATHYRKDMIASHFGDGANFGLEIRYVEEVHPLGTAGALGFLETSDDPLLVINGDVLTTMNFRAMLDFHRDHDADMTVAVRPYEFQVPYGVLDVDGHTIRRIQEKPVFRKFINAGIYLLNSGLCQCVPSGRRCDMPELISELVGQGYSIVSFPVHEYWTDVGELQAYEKALSDIKNGETTK